MILVNFKTYPQGTGERAVRLAKVCLEVEKETGVKIIPVVQAVDLWQIKQELPSLSVFVQHVDLFPPGAHTGWTNLEAVVEAGASGTLLNHSEHPMPPGSIRQIIAKIKNEKSKMKNFKTVVCCKTLGQVQRLVKLKPDFLAYEPPELIGAQKVSVATVQPKMIEKVVKIGQAKGIPVIVGAGIHSPKDVKISLEKGARGVLVSSFVVLAKEPKIKLAELAKALSKSKIQNPKSKNLSFEL